MRDPKMWQRGQDGGYYVTIRGIQTPLGRDKAVATKKYHAILAKEGQPVADQSVYKLCNLYLNWCKANKAEETFRSRRHHLKRILSRIGRQRNTTDLRPFHVQQCLDTDYVGWPVAQTATEPADYALALGKGEPCSCLGPSRWSV